MHKDQRLLDLAALLLKAAEPVSWREIQEQFPEDYAGTGDAAIRKFERDKADLLELGIPVRYAAGDEDLPAGYLIDKDEFYLPDLKLAAGGPGAAVRGRLRCAGAGHLSLRPRPGPRDEQALLRGQRARRLRVGGAGGAPPLREDAAAAPVGGPLAGGAVPGHRPQEAGAPRLPRGRAARGPPSGTSIPYGLFQKGGAWYLSGWCHLRQDIRTFHLSRIVSLAGEPGRASHPRLHAPQRLLAGRAGHARALGVPGPRAAALPRAARLAGLRRRCSPPSAAHAKVQRRGGRGGGRGRGHQLRGAAPPRPLARAAGPRSWPRAPSATGPARCSRSWPRGVA